MPDGWVIAPKFAVCFPKMDDTRSRRPLQFWTPLLFSLILIAGMVLGFNLRDTLRNKRDLTTIIERNDRLEQIIDLVREKYVDSVNTNDLYSDAVAGIISHLDPHTAYIPPTELTSINEDLSGSFSGIGVEFSIGSDTIRVTSIIEGGPAEKVGVEAGDQLIKVGDSVVAGVGITSDRIISMLRGKQHSQVVVSMLSSTTGKLKNIIIERDAVPIYSVEASVMLGVNTGYIKINRFSANTEEEFRKAITELTTQGATQIILDLRQNPGGYLDAATMVADELIGGHKLIVYTEGRNAKRTEYKTSEQGAFETGKLAILVDEGSASASEVLAGAIQDWDRGVIVGRRTFGKGLVQQQYDMEDGAALRLTIARYYTPSGRSIQRTYNKGKQEYQEDIERRVFQELHDGRDSMQSEDTFRYFTAKGRLVYGGGGIAPDIYVPFDTARINSGLTNMLYSEDLKNAIWDYFIKNKKELRRYRTWQDYQESFNPNALIQRFLVSQNALNSSQFRVMMRLPLNQKYFETMVKAQLGRLLFRNRGYYGIVAGIDNMVQAAIKAFESKNYDSIIGR